MMKKTAYLLVIASCFILVACGGGKPVKPSTTTGSSTSGGGYYGSDGPHANPPKNLDRIPDAVPKVEALYKYSSKPYMALGKKYYPLKTAKGYKKQGMASWYGKQFHGKKTAIGEVYDMYGMTAAHTLLPLPSYVKVTNVENGRSVVVRVNDRGPFKHKREIDLSYAAAYKLRLIEKGTGLVKVETLDPRTYKPEKKTVTAAPAPKPVAIKRHYVQAGAFGEEMNAIKLQNRIEGLDIAEISRINRMYNNGLYRLTVGPYSTKAQAENVAKRIQQRLNTPTLLILK